nr:sigma factor [Nitriliruptor alkaliphilus]
MPPLSSDQERTLVPRAQDGDQAAVTRLLCSQLPWLRREAHRRVRLAPRTSWEDLASVGAIAFLEALETFDLDRGVRLYTHARRPVEAAMAAEVAAWSGPMPVPDTTFRKVAAGLRNSGDTEEAGASVCRSRTGMDPETFHAVRAVKRWAANEAVTSVAGGPDRLARSVPVTYRPGRTFPDPVVRLLLDLALQALAPRARRVLDLTVMAEPGSRLTDVQAGSVLGISRHTVMRERGEALAVLRELLGEDFHAYVYPPRRRQPKPRPTEAVAA